jgi:hypothetical protein
MLFDTNYQRAYQKPFGNAMLFQKKSLGNKLALPPVNCRRYTIVTMRNRSLGQRKKVGDLKVKLKFDFKDTVGD